MLFLIDKNNMLKKKICWFFFWNFELFIFFFPKKFEINKKLKLNFAIRLYLIFDNFDLALKVKFILFIIFMNVSSFIFYLKFFKFIKLEQKEKFIQKLVDLNINILSRGIVALKSQSIIILYPIYKGNLNEFR